jgi:hypothetical protein
MDEGFQKSPVGKDRTANASQIGSMDENPYQAPQAMPAGEEPPAEPAEGRPPLWFLVLHGIAYFVALAVINETFRLGRLARLATLLAAFTVIAAVFAAMARRLFASQHTP